MDMSLVAAVMTMQTGAAQSRLANAVLKSSLDEEKTAVQILLGAGEQSLSLANLAAGIGGNLDISA